MKPGRLFAAAIAVAIMAAGCTPDYNPSSFIEKYRIIGVQAEPSTVAFTPDYQGRVNLKLLDAFPSRPLGDEVAPVVNSIEWSVCLMSLGANVGFACTMDEIPLTDVSPDGRQASLDGAMIAGGIEFLRPAFDQVIEGLKKAVQFGDECTFTVLASYDECMKTGTVETCRDPAFDGYKACIYLNGLIPVFHVTVNVTEMQLDYSDEPVLGADGLPVMIDRDVQVFKSVSFWNWGPDKPANRNPEFMVYKGLYTLDEVPAPENLIVSTADGVQKLEVAACPGELLEFTGVVPPDSIDPARDADGMPLLEPDGLPTPEYYFQTWYANGGRFDSLRKGSYTLDGGPPDLTNTLYFPADQPVPLTTVQVTMHDEMYGLASLSFTVTQDSRDNCAIKMGGRR